MSTRKIIVVLFIMSFIFLVLGFIGPRENLDFAFSFLGGGVFALALKDWGSKEGRKRDTEI
jgi:zinc transporter ZupT